MMRDEQMQALSDRLAAIQAKTPVYLARLAAMRREREAREREAEVGVMTGVMTGTMTGTMTFDEMVAIAQELRANGWTISEMALIDVSYDVLSGREPERYRLQAMRDGQGITMQDASVWLRVREALARPSTTHERTAAHPSERRADGQTRGE